MVFWTFDMAYVQYEVSGLSVGSGVTWWPKAGRGMVQRKGITKFDKCKSSEMITINVKIGRQLQ